MHAFGQRDLPPLLQRRRLPQPHLWPTFQHLLVTPDRLRIRGTCPRRDPVHCPRCTQSAHRHDREHHLRQLFDPQRCRRRLQPDRATRGEDDHPRSTVRTRRARAVLPSPRIIAAFWIAVIDSANIQAEDSTMSWRSSARLSRRRKLTLNHPIFTRWPAQYPDRLQLFSLPTANGVKVGIMLEETSLAYEPHRIDIMADESHDPAFLALNPNGKILESTARSRAPGRSSPSRCSASSCSKAVLRCSQGSTWRWLSPRAPAFSPRSWCSSSSRGPTSTSSPDD